MMRGGARELRRQQRIWNIMLFDICVHVDKENHAYKTSHTLDVEYIAYELKRQRSTRGFGMKLAKHFGHYVEFKFLL